MPPKRSADAPKDTPECILRIGKNCNIIAWMEEMETALTGLYGLTGAFFTTNERYVPLFPVEGEYAPPSDSDDDDKSDVIDEEVEAQKSEEDRERAAEERRVSARKARDKLTGKLRELAFEARRKDVAQITKDQRLIYPMLWVKMSAASQSKVREDPEFKITKENLDCILHLCYCHLDLAYQTVGQGALGNYTEIPPYSHIWDRGPDERNQCERTRIKVREPQTGGSRICQYFQAKV
jgi:hypothetical protein